MGIGDEGKCLCVVCQVRYVSLMYSHMFAVVYFLRPSNGPDFHECLLPPPPGPPPPPPEMDEECEKGEEDEEVAEDEEEDESEVLEAEEV